MPRLLTVAMAAAGLAFVYFAGAASWSSTGSPLAAPALYALAGACFLLASWAFRRSRSD